MSLLYAGWDFPHEYPETVRWVNVELCANCGYEPDYCSCDTAEEEDTPPSVTSEAEECPFCHQFMRPDLMSEHYAACYADQGAFSEADFTD